MPKRLEQSAKACVLLLLSELLRLRRPDLKPVEPRSLVNLVGRRGRLRPKLTDSKDAVEFVEENLALIPANRRPKDEAALFGEALQELTDGSPGFDFTEGGDPVPPGRVAELLSEQGLIAVPLPGFRLPPSFLKGKPTPPIKNFKRVFTDPEISEPVCRFIGTFFLAAMLRGGSPLIKAAAGAAAMGCSVGVSRGT